MISVGFHGFLGVAFPIPASEKLNPIKAPVNIVRLSPAEQTRLPNLAPPPLILPPTPSLNAYVPPISNSSAAVTSPPTPEFQLYEPPSRQETLNIPADRLPEAATIPPEILQAIAPPPPPIIAPEPLPETSPPMNQLPALEPGTVTIDQLPPEKQEALRQALRQNEEEAQAQLEALNRRFSPSPSPKPESPVAPPTPQPSPSTAENLEKVREEQRQARAGNLQPDNQDTTSAADRAAIAQQLEQRRQAFRNLITYNPAGTTAERDVVTANFGNWLAQARQNSGNPELMWEKQAIAASYPDAARSLKLQGTALVGVLVNAEGKLMGEPQLFQSSGYPILNQAALEAVKQHEFAAAGTVKAYSVEIRFEPPSAETPS